MPFDNKSGQEPQFTNPENLNDRLSQVSQPQTQPTTPIALGEGKGHVPHNTNITTAEIDKWLKNFENTPITLPPPYTHIKGRIFTKDGIEVDKYGHIVHNK